MTQARHVQSGRGFQGVSKGVSNFTQGVSLGVSLCLLELCVCIKYLKLGDATLTDLIQTHLPYSTPQVA